MGTDNWDRINSRPLNADRELIRILNEEVTRLERIISTYRQMLASQGMSYDLLDDVEYDAYNKEDSE